MTGGDDVSFLSHPFEEGTELDAPVAEDVGTRRAAGAQLGEDMFDDTLVVIRLQRDDLQRHAAGLAGGAHEAHVLLPRAVAGEGLHLVFEPDLEVIGCQVGPFLLQQAQGDGAVDAPGQQNGGLHARRPAIMWER